MATSDPGKGRARDRFLQSFTAVDLVTIAAFAAAWRVTHLAQKFANFAYPLNVAFWYAFFAWALAAVLILVPKRWTVSLYSGLGVLGINILLEGDPPQWLLTIPPAIIITEAIFQVLEKTSGAYGTTLRTAVIGLTLAAPIWWLAIIFFGLKIVFGTPMGAGALVATFVVFMVSAPVFGYLGHKVGKTVQPLLTS